MKQATAGDQPARPIRELEAEITELAGHLNAAQYRWLCLIAEFDRRNGWSDGGTQTCAHWLNWKCGIDMGAAREKVRVAHALEQLPRISLAMAEGRLSYSKVRALTRVAIAQTEQYLLDIALCGTAAHVEKLVRCYRRAQEAEELSREARQQATRSVSYFYDADGSLVLRGRLPAEIGAVVIKALDAAVERAVKGAVAGMVEGAMAGRPKPGDQPVWSDELEDSDEAGAGDQAASAQGTAGLDGAEGSDRAESGEWAKVGDGTHSSTQPDATDQPDEDDPCESGEGGGSEPGAVGHRAWRNVSAETSGERPSWGALRADALGRIAESFLQHGEAALTSADRQQLIVHVDVQVLSAGGPGRCELEDGPSLAAETARRLGCDASILTLVENEEGEPLSIGRRSRVLSPALHRALKARDHGCRFPGCPNTRYVDAHHIRHWAQGGETKLSNLVQLCRFHHRQVHEGRVVMQHLDDGALRFLRPDGEAFDSTFPAGSAGAGTAAAPPSDWQQLPATHEQQGLHIDQDTAATLWRGEKMDYDLAVDGLFQRARRGRQVSAET